MSLSKLQELVMDRDAWRAASKSQTRLSSWTELNWAPPPSLSATKLLWCQMAKVSSKRSPMTLSFLFANNKRVRSTEGHCLASWWYSTWINVIVTVPKSCYCNTLMKGSTDEIDGTRLKSWCKVCFCACLLTCFSCVQLFAILWTVAHQALLSMGFSRQKDWSGLPCSLTGDLSHPEIESTCLMSPALSGGLFTTSITRKACLLLWWVPKK